MGSTEIAQHLVYLPRRTAYYLLKWTNFHDLNGSVLRASRRNSTDCTSHTHNILYSYRYKWGLNVMFPSDDDSWNLVTCFCRRPFAGRPMIECSKCQTWVHLFCANIKKEQVPDTYFCPKCSTSSGARSRS